MNWGLPSLDAESLKITLTAPLIEHYAYSPFKSEFLETFQKIVRYWNWILDYIFILYICSLIIFFLSLFLLFVFDHISGTHGPICVKFKFGKWVEQRECVNLC